MKRVAAALVLVSIAVACGKEEWNRNQLGASSPWAETDETEPAADDPVDDAGDSTIDATTSDVKDGGVDASDARPADARADRG